VAQELGGSEQVELLKESGDVVDHDICQFKNVEIKQAKATVD